MNSFKRHAVALWSLFAGCAALAENPIFTTAYTADPAARVLGGRVYVFTSEDPPDNTGPVIVKHRLYSSDDLCNWTDHGPVIQLKDVPWAREFIWAPDWIKKGDTFYYFVPAPQQKGGFRRIGLMTAKTPTGPYVSMEQPMKLDGDFGGDPAVFLDDDNTAYLYWSIKGKAKGGKLKADMTDVEGEVRTLEGVPRHMEGCSVFKRNNIYYLTHVTTKPSKRVQYLAYSMADHPLGPFRPQGHYAQMAQGANNIHQSQIEFNGQWYVFYHDTSLAYDSNPIKRRRAVRLDKLEFNADGTIKPVVWTTTGPPPLKNLNPYEPLLAETGRPGNPEQTEWAKGEDQESPYLVIEQEGTRLTYEQCDFGHYFGDTDALVEIRLKPLQKGRLRLHLDSLSAPPIAEGDFAPSAEWQKLSLKVFRAVGVRRLLVVFSGEEKNKPLCLFDQIQFTRPQPEENKK